MVLAEEECAFTSQFSRSCGSLFYIKRKLKTVIRLPSLLLTSGFPTFCFDLIFFFLIRGYILSFTYLLCIITDGTTPSVPFALGSDVLFLGNMGPRGEGDNA